jgi:hypothetical protein
MKRPGLMFALVLGLLLSSAMADDLPVVAGVNGLVGNDEPAWLAVRIAVPEDSALAGILWYNNDGQVTYPGLLVGTGHAQGPGLIDEMTALSGPFFGDSDAWSELTLAEPVVASQGAVYVVFEFPAGVEFTGRGQGGGPALGYLDGTAGTPGWVSGDGEMWMRLAADHSFAIMPQYVPFEPGMLVKSLGGEPESADDLPQEPYLLAGPNPFNPKTEIRFGLTRAGHARLVVFDIRGRRVTQLLSEPLVAGHHTVAWMGRDDRGRGVASGVYFVRLSSGHVQLTQRVLLLR